MIEFYHKYFSNSYNQKVNQLVNDIERLLYLENINIEFNDEITLDPQFKFSLTQNQWIHLNNLYFTLNKNHNYISDLLKKFLVRQSKKDNIKRHCFIDTFAGAGGLSLGLCNAGFSPVLVNEIEPKFLETYYFNHDLSLESYLCDDIKELVEGKTLNNLEFDNIDLVVGGPPCQGFSMANRQRILEDPRNELYKQFLKLLAKTRPKFFVMENVKGMINKSTEIIENFKSMLGKDYSIRIILLNASNFGVPQNRERVFVIGTRLQHVDMDMVLEEINSHKFTRRKYFLKNALLGLPEIHPKREKNKSKDENENIGYKFRLSENDVNNNFTDFIGGQGLYITNHTNRYNNERDIEIFNRLPQGSNSLHFSIADIMPYSSRNHMFKDKYYKLKENNVCKTITSHMKFDCNMYIHPSQARGLSPREAARVQTFPDDYVFMGANNLWYAQIGNAVPVKLAQVIGEVIMKHLN